ERNLEVVAPGRLLTSIQQRVEIEDLEILALGQVQRQLDAAQLHFVLVRDNGLDAARQDASHRDLVTVRVVVRSTRHDGLLAMVGVSGGSNLTRATWPSGYSSPRPVCAQATHHER